MCKSPLQHLLRGHIWLGNNGFWPVPCFCAMFRCGWGDFPWARQNVGADSTRIERGSSAGQSNILQKDLIHVGYLIAFSRCTTQAFCSLSRCLVCPKSALCLFNTADSHGLAEACLQIHSASNCHMDSSFFPCIGTSMRSREPVACGRRGML